MQRLTFTILFAVALSSANRPAMADFQVDGEMEFWNEILDFQCQKLVVDGEELGWITSFQSSQSFLTFQHCIADGLYEQLDQDPPRVSGYSSPQQYLDLSSPKTRGEITAPMYDYFANHKLCDDKIAYWGIEDSESGGMHDVSTMVYDLSANSLLHSSPLGEDRLETDNPGHFNSPDWDNTCTSVEFSEYFEQGTRRITITLE